VQVNAFPFVFFEEARAIGTSRVAPAVDLLSELMKFPRDSVTQPLARECFGTEIDFP